MTFRLHHAQYDSQTERAYVEFRCGDGDGGEQVVVAVFTFRTKERLTKQRIKEEVVRKARHVLKGAVLAA
jgi:quercetin dioxygenase-like cupin family protein